MSAQQVNADKIREGISQLREVVQQLQSAMSLAEEAAARVKANWESSEAAPAFYSVIAKWQEKGPTLLQDTQKIITFLTDAANTYDAAEKRLTAN
jgi:uncharacterized protein YukE